MSVLAYTPRSKRLFEDSENEQQGGDSPSVVKRARCNASPAGLSYGSRLPSSTPWLDGPGSIHPATVAALKGLFPGMDDQVSGRRALLGACAPAHRPASPRGPAPPPSSARPAAP
jgi:hypothetical protein